MAVITRRARALVDAPLGLLDTMGDQAAFYAKTIGWIPRTLRRYKREVLRLLTEVAFGSGALALIGGTVVIVATLTFFTGSVVGLQSYSALNQIGTSAFAGFVTAYFNTREVAPLVGALALSATVGAGFTAQLGAQRVSEEIDALEVMAVPSLPFLVTSRVIAGFIAVIPLYVIGLVASYFASRLLVTNFYTQSSGTYDHYFNLFLPPNDVVYSFAKVLHLRLRDHPDPLLLRLQRRRRTGRRGRGGRQRGAQLHRRVHGPGQPADPRDLGHHDVDPDRGMTAPTKDLRPPLSPTRRRLSGLVLLLVMILIVTACLLNFNKVFKPVEMVTLQTDTVGNQLSKQGDVKVRGVIVGEIKSVESDGQRATVEMAMDPDALSAIPSNVTAMLIPKTLFGERYISLNIPPNPTPRRLQEGDVIGQDRSQNATETEQVLNNLMPVLTAVQPQKLSDTLGAISQALSGRGQQLGGTLVQLNQLLEGTNPSLPDLLAVINRLSPTADIYNAATPDLIGALDNLVTTSRTLVQQRAAFESTFRTVTSASNVTTDFLVANRDNIINLAATSLPVLDLLARYSPEFPCLFQQLTT